MDKLQVLYNQCLSELNSINIDTSDIGNINISLSKRTCKRYGCCKQEEPDRNFRNICRVGYKKIIKYEKFNKHYIEISKWVMNLNDDIIKNTIMHEIIHCFPYCNNHGKMFKQYANIINRKLGYNIRRVGDKKIDYKESNILYKESQNLKYKIECQKCGQIFFRQRLNKDLIKKYRCGLCMGKFRAKRIVE